MFIVLTTNRSVFAEASDELTVAYVLFDGNIRDQNAVLNVRSTSTFSFFGTLNVINESVNAGSILVFPLIVVLPAARFSCIFVSFGFVSEG